MRYPIFLLCFPLLTVAQNLETILQRQENGAIFLQGLQAFPDLLRILSDRTARYTLLVPQDSALQNSPRWTNRLWTRHLRETLRTHFIPGELLTQTGLAERTELLSLANTSLSIGTDGTIAGSSVIIDGDKQAVNGILHLIDQPLPTALDSVTFADLIATDYPHLAAFMEVTNSRALLSQESNNGYSWIGCSEEAFNRMDDYLKPLEGNSVPQDEFRNEATRDHFFQFNMVPQIYDPALLDNGFLAVSSTPCGNMWVTFRNGTLCFQNACVVGNPIMTNNGLAFQTDQCLVCPGIVMTAAVDPARTTLNTTDFINIFRMTGWNERDLRPYFDGQSVTLFASINEGWAKMTPEDMERLNAPEWRYHLMDLITSQIAPGRWTLEDLYNYYLENGAYYLTMMNGDTLEIDYNGVTELLQAGSGDDRGDFYLANMEGIDGLIHFTTHTPNAASLTRNLYQTIQRDPASFSNMLAYISSAAVITTGLAMLSPRSIMMVEDAAWNRHEFQIETVSIVSEVINSHIFPSVLSCEGLRESVGSEITSLNGKLWRISLNARDLPCLQYVDESGALSPDSLACVVKCDIVAKNGMAFYVDNLLLSPGIASPKAPTVSPSAAPTSTPNSTAAPTGALNEDIDLDPCFELIEQADRDGNGILLRPEYNSLVAAYSQLKCQDSPNVLNSNQQNVFRELSCRCQERGEDDSCCDGTNANILLDEDDEVRTELCQRIDRNAGEDMCTDGSLPAPTPDEEPIFLFSPTASPISEDTPPVSGAGGLFVRTNVLYIMLGIGFAIRYL